MSFFDCSPCELIALAASISIALSKELSNEELAVLGAFFSVLGDNLSLLAT